MTFDYIHLAKRYKDIAEEEFNTNMEDYLIRDVKTFLEYKLEEKTIELLVEEATMYMSTDAKNVLNEFIDHFEETIKGYTGELVFEIIYAQLRVMYETKEITKIKSRYKNP